MNEISTSSKSKSSIITNSTSNSWWTTKRIELLTSLVEKQETSAPGIRKDWISIANKLGMNHSANQCRLKYRNLQDQIERNSNSIDPFWSKTEIESLKEIVKRRDALNLKRDWKGITKELNGTKGVASCKSKWSAIRPNDYRGPNSREKIISPPSITVLPSSSSSYSSSFRDPSKHLSPSRLASTNTTRSSKSSTSLKTDTTLPPPSHLSFQSSFPNKRPHNTSVLDQSKVNTTVRVTLSPKRSTTSTLLQIQQEKEIVKDNIMLPVVTQEDAKKALKRLIEMDWDDF